MALSLANAIKFRCFMDELSQNEFMQFMNKIFEINNACIIKTSLFNHFIETNSNELDNINSILSKIIQSRKQKPKQLPVINIKLNELPRSIIGHTSSFLTQVDYFDFAQTNRSIFVACNSPNMLTQLDLVKENINIYSLIPLAKFQSLNSIEIDITKFNEFTLPNNEQFIMNELEKLALFANYEKDFEIETFMEQKCINMANIKSLQLCQFGDAGMGNRFSCDKFYRLLTKFPNIEYMEFYNVFLSTIFDVAKVKQLCPYVSGLSIVGGNGRICNSLINEFGHNLEFLLFSRGSHSFTDFSNINFNNLQQIILECPNAKIINDILKTAQNIQKFAIYPYHYDKILLTEQEFKTIIPQILKCESLKYLEIEINNQNYASIFDGIEDGLYETVKWEREQIKIRVGAQKQSKIDIKKILFKVGAVIHWLQTSNIKDFMFILDMNKIDKRLQKKLDVPEILNDLKNISSDIEIAEYELHFVITNKNCKINGFGAAWKFETYLTIGI